jgi:putative ABC transport system substrate-binding protein
MIDRRTFLAGTGAVLLAAPLAAEGQQAATKTPRIVLLDASSMVARAHEWNLFRQSLRELGYVEGQNIAIESRSADARYEHLPGLAAELVRLKPDLIVTAGAPAALAAKQATTTASESAAVIASLGSMLAILVIRGVSAA